MEILVPDRGGGPQITLDAPNAPGRLILCSIDLTSIKKKKNKKLRSVERPGHTRKLIWKKRELGFLDRHPWIPAVITNWWIHDPGEQKKDCPCLPYQKPCVHVFLYRYPEISSQRKAAMKFEVTTEQWLWHVSPLKTGAAFFFTDHSLHSLTLSQHSVTSSVYIRDLFRIRETPTFMSDFSRGCRHGRVSVGASGLVWGK